MSAYIEFLWHWRMPRPSFGYLLPGQSSAHSITSSRESSVPVGLIFPFWRRSHLDLAVFETGVYWIHVPVNDGSVTSAGSWTVRGKDIANFTYKGTRGAKITKASLAPSHEIWSGGKELKFNSKETLKGTSVLVFKKLFSKLWLLIQVGNVAEKGPSGNMYWHNLHGWLFPSN